MLVCEWRRDRAGDLILVPFLAYTRLAHAEVSGRAGERVRGGDGVAILALMLEMVNDIDDYLKLVMGVRAGVPGWWELEILYYRRCARGRARTRARASK